MLNRVLFWFKNARLFSLPMTLMSWLVAFSYSLKLGARPINGIIALIGIIFAHLATNLYDDYSDYKSGLKRNNYQIIKAKSKCEYLKNGNATLSELLNVIIIYCSIAVIIGLYLAIVAGWQVMLLALIGGILTLTYPKISSAGYSELYVGIAFGPLLFEGVYFVMCHGFSSELLLISLAVVAFTVGVVYMNNFLDYDNDIAERKKSICTMLGNKQKAATGLLFIYCIGYVFCLILTGSYWNYVYYIPALTLPLAYEVFLSAQKYGYNKDVIPPVKWWHYPLDNWKEVQKSGHASFYLRLFLSRNLMMWFALLMCVAVWFS